MKLNSCKLNRKGSTAMNQSRKQAAQPGSADGRRDVCICTNQVSTIHLQDLSDSAPHDSEWLMRLTHHSLQQTNIKTVHRWEKPDKVAQTKHHYLEAQRSLKNKQLRKPLSRAHPRLSVQVGREDRMWATRHALRGCERLLDSFIDEFLTDPTPASTTRMCLRLEMIGPSSAGLCWQCLFCAGLCNAASNWLLTRRRQKKATRLTFHPPSRLPLMTRYHLIHPD